MRSIPGTGPTHRRDISNCKANTHLEYVTEGETKRILGGAVFYEHEGVKIHSHLQCHVMEPQRG